MSILSRRPLTVVAATLALLFILPGGAFAQSLGTCKLGVCDPVPVGDPPPQQLVVNGGFEFPNTTFVTWFTPGIAFFNPALAHCGKLSMTLPGGSGGRSQLISQSLSIPGSVSHVYLDFWLFEPVAESDFLIVQMGIRVVADLVGTGAGKWMHVGLVDIDVSAFSGRSVPLTFSGGSVSGQGPSIDDVSVTTGLHLLSNLC